MKQTEERITGFLHSRNAAAVFIAASFVGLYLAYSLVKIPHIDYDKGLGLPSADLWISNPSTSFWVNMLMTLIAGGLMLYINGRFNLIRDITRLYTGLFLVMQCASPMIGGQFFGGTMLLVVMLLSIILLYSVYNKPSYTKRIFLVFFFLAAGALTQYGFIIYMTIFLMGCGQMRAFTMKTFMAAVIGVITPVWILWAFGWWSPAEVRLPEFTNFVADMGRSREIQFIAVTGFTVAVGFALCVLNLVKVFTYNSRARAYNGFVALLLFMTCALIVIDFTNIPFYLPLLNCCVAFQGAQFFVINRSRRSYIVILGIVGVYCGLYAWWLAL